MSNATPQDRERGQEIAESIMKHLQKIEGYQKEIKSLLMIHGDELSIELGKQAKRSQAKAHLDWWSLCRAVGLNEGGK